MSAIIRLFKSKLSAKDRFQALLRPHIELMYRMAYRLTQSQSEAEDLVQDVLTRLAKRVDEMEQVESLRPWVLRILQNRFVDLYRREQNSPVDYQSAQEDDSGEDDRPGANVLTTASDSTNDIKRLELQQVLQVALNKLDDAHRDVVMLHDMEGYTALEVADILGINVGTVKSRLHRARDKLKKWLEDP